MAPKMICKFCQRVQSEENSSGLCEFCGKPIERTPYLRDVQRGLERLEREKMGFLGKGAVISKFDSAQRERFEETLAQETHPTEVVCTDQMVDVGNADDEASAYDLSDFRNVPEWMDDNGGVTGEFNEIEVIDAQDADKTEAGSVWSENEVTAVYQKDQPNTELSSDNSPENGIDLEDIKTIYEVRPKNLERRMPAPRKRQETHIGLAGKAISEPASDDHNTLTMGSVRSETEDNIHAPALASVCGAPVSVSLGGQPSSESAGKDPTFNLDHLLPPANIRKTELSLIDIEMKKSVEEDDASLSGILHPDRKKRQEPVRIIPRHEADHLPEALKAELDPDHQWKVGAETLDPESPELSLLSEESPEKCDETGEEAPQVQKDQKTAKKGHRKKHENKESHTSENTDDYSELSEDEQLIHKIEAEERAREKRNRIGQVCLWVFVFLLAACVILAWLHREKRLPSGISDQISHIPVVGNYQPQMLEDKRFAIQNAQELVHNAIFFEEYLPQQLLRKSEDDTLSTEDRVRTLKFLYDLYPGPEMLQTVVKHLLELEQYEEARAFLRPIKDDSPENHELYIDSFRQDPHFISEAETLKAEDFDMISPLGGGSTLTFKLIRKGETVAAFKPLQTRRQSNYRSEIAAWRLCELIQCDFNIPYNKPFKIEYSVFNELYNRSNSAKRDEYRTGFPDLIWEKEADGKRYLYGTFKEWVPKYTRFPIEMTSLWHPWLRQKDGLESPLPELSKALQPIQHRKLIYKIYNQILSQKEDLTTEGLASQVSEILVFDYLTGNWDRFSGVEDWWGVNCQFAKGHIVSIDNGAAFQPYTNDKVNERYNMTEKFGRHFVQELRLLDKETTRDFLFPNPSSREAKAFEQFWKQRDAFLARVDRLIAQYGEQNVLVFD